MSKNVVIAIDGPAGAGKSTVAKHLAQMLDYVYLDTGAMYRAITFIVLRNSVENNREEIIKIAQNAKVELKFENSTTRVFINGEEITNEIRTPEVNNHVSEVSKIPEVREAMVKIQRNLGMNTNLITEGRDTTTIVFPDATIKVFLTASLDERTKRRHKELVEKGVQLSLNEVRENIIERDRIDSGRKISPLMKAKDAVEIDSTNMTIPDEIYKILDMIEAATGMKLRQNI